ncbi:hypothetical protein DFH07DRAFT_777724 [Mycena maculata]|uniref:RING-type domain-containing protein n=1 Tax=Mycena maculata TaxID=230809 RepID=A0AAD7IGC7_9AGAR|nr:hypothetical protein DFH07DRAFT_777724 [Mycena maculata]
MSKPPAAISADLTTVLVPRIYQIDVICQMAWVPKPPPFTVYHRGNTTDTAGSRTVAHRVRRMAAHIQNRPPSGREILRTVPSPTLTLWHHAPSLSTAALSATTYTPPAGPPPEDDSPQLEHSASDVPAFTMIYAPPAGPHPEDDPPHLDHSASDVPASNIIYAPPTGPPPPEGSEYNSLNAIRSRIAQLQGSLTSWLAAPFKIYPASREAREAYWARERLRDKQMSQMANRGRDTDGFLPYIRRSGGRRIHVRRWPGASRRSRDRPLTDTDLLINGTAPPVQLPNAPHHKCTLCHLVKSHPVSYLCGHSHCYVCIRLWLEDDWTCPDCYKPMYRPPFRQYGEEDWIAKEYPKWIQKDRSVVDYSWDGLWQWTSIRFSCLTFKPLAGRFFDYDIAVGFDDEDDDAGVAFDRGVYFSSDGRRRDEEMLNVSHKKRRVQPNDLTDAYAEWIPVPSGAYEEVMERDSDTNPINCIGTKRREYASSDDPMSLWRPLKALFSDELLRHNSLGDDLDHPACVFCKKEHTTTPNAVTRIFKCGDCGQFLQCMDCCVSRHALTPLHTVQEWNGSFWAKSSLAALGLVYQLGHGGFPCVYPDERIRKLTVIEAPIIYEVRVRYCKCDKSDEADNLAQLLRNAWYPVTVTDPGTCATFKTLDTFRQYNVVGNMNVHDFIHAMERTTDATASTGMAWLPDRYKPFQHMSRQWGFLHRVQRSGCAHKAGGVDVGWRDVDPQFRFLYMLLLALDANFKLKNRMRTNEIDDPSLGPGWGYWVEPRRYKRHLGKYVAEKDASTCIAFAALLQKDTRLTTGLRASGVGGCVCARHECVRPNGLGDLQKGERYANMDYILMSALVGFTLMLLMISYDIACQWQKNLKERNAKMPHSTSRSSAPYVWHAASHDDDCKDANSLSFKPGVGKSDGEGVEQVWSVLNPAAYHTKDAGRSQRADTLEDKIGSHNFLKNIGQGQALQRKLIVDIAERDHQVEAFKEVTRTVERPVKKQWTKMIDEWLKDASKPNPYALSRKDCPSEAQVRVDCQKEEDESMAGATSEIWGRSATVFLTAGLQIEQAQRCIVSEVSGRVLVTADRESKIFEWRCTLLGKIRKFRILQAMYMPGAAAVIAAAEEARDADDAPPKAEHIRLFMPSDMAPGRDPLRGCVSGLLGLEYKLRVGQCTNALVTLRSRLHAKRHLIMFRNENLAGQNLATKGATLIGQVGERVEAAAAKELRPEDVQLDGDAGESDAAARVKLAMLGAGRGARAPRNAPGTSKRVMSWIWTAPGALDDEDLALHESVRVEWTRVLARKVRWEEEVRTLREEMRRVLRYLRWQSQWWRDHVEERSEDVSRAVAAGIRAYTMKQADLHDRLAVFFKKKWNMSVMDAAKDLVASESAAEAEVLDLSQLFSQPR